MKKLGGILALFVLTLTLILPVSAANLFQKDLRYGMTKNIEVKRLQQYLKDEKVYTGPLSGNYYGLTQSAVNKLQKKYGLKQDGKFSKILRDKINSLLLTKEETKQLTQIQTEEEQLAESIAALKLYELTKAQEQVQKGVLTPEEFAIRYPNANPFPTLSINTPIPQSQTTQNNTQTQLTNTSTPTPQLTDATTTPNPATTEINWSYGLIYNSLPSSYSQDSLLCIEGNGQTGYGTSDPITNSDSDRTIGYFSINGTSTNQINTGPFIKSVTLQNSEYSFYRNSTYLDNLNIIGFVEGKRFDIGQIQYNVVGYTKPLILYPSTTSSNSVTFILPTSTTIYRSNNDSIYTVTSTKVMEMSFKIDPTKMNRGDALKFKVINAELVSSDPTKNYTLTLPIDNSPSKRLIKCDLKN